MNVPSNTNNIILGNLSQAQLTELFFRINETPIYFRTKLNLPTSITFGNEIEINGIPLDVAMLITGLFNDVHDLEGYSRYSAHIEETASAEIITPVSKNRIKDWTSFYDMYQMLRDTGATIAGNTSSHVHLGTHRINTPEKLSLLLKTLVVFEPIIYKFGYGVNNEPRSFLRFNSNTRCIFSPLMSPKRVRTFTDALDSFNYKNPGLMYSHFKEFLSEDLYFRPVFNFKNFDFSKLQYGNEMDVSTDDHFEVRCFNGTLYPQIAQNNINLVASILSAVIEGKIDAAYVQAEYDKYKKKRYSFEHKYGIIQEESSGEQYNRLLDGYSKVKMDKALKLADMIFDTELDKYYFLKQYLKLFNATPEYVKSLTK